MTRKPPVGPFPWRSGLLILAGLAIGAVGVLVRSARVGALVLLLVGVVVTLAGIVGLWRGARWGGAAVLALLGSLLALSIGAEVWLAVEASRGHPDLVGAIVGCALFVVVFLTAFVMAVWAYQGRTPRRRG